MNRGLLAAERGGRLSATPASAARRTLEAFDHGVVTLSSRAQTIALWELHDVAANASVFNRARIAALIGGLGPSIRYLRRDPQPAEGTTISDAGGVRYRLFDGHGFQFHPLASFGALNALVSKNEPVAAGRLARALVQRGIRYGGTLVWEYSFPFGGPQRWTSGFAQSVAANALERTALLVHDSHLAAAAAAAFRAIEQHYLHPLNGGQWILEYSFSSMLTLNAQLESLLQLTAYARESGSAAAERTARAMLDAVTTNLPRFDLGCWSRYSLGGNRATSHYHTYHIQLLYRLAHTSGDIHFAQVATRWNRGLHGTC